MAATREPPASPERAPPALPELSAIVLVLSGPIARAAVSRLCERVRVLLERSHADLVVCDVGALVEPDAVTLDALARLQLTARRLGRRVRLLDACGRLRDLIGLAGLTEVVPCMDAGE